MNPNEFAKLPSCWVLSPPAHTVPYPAKIVEDDGGEQLLIAPDNDRGMEGEAYWIYRDRIQLA